MPDAEDDRAMIEKCRELAPGAYAPYSKFYVASAVRTSTGVVHRGLNMENASYGMTMCAEIGALTAVNAAGDLSKIRAIYVVGGTLGTSGKLEGKNVVTPCGRCRQLIREAASVSGHD